jgi:acylglycerol lipase
MDHSVSKLPSGTVVHTWHTTTPRAVVIIQHGFSEYAERYVDQYGELVPKLTKQRFEVRALDMWGHGRSPGTRGVTHVGKAVQDHVLLRQQSSRDNPNLPIFLFGHSLGGLVTAGSIVADPSHITGVVLTGPALPKELPWIARYVIGVLAALFPTTSIPLKRAPRSGLSRIPEVLAEAEVDERMTQRQIPFLLAATAIDTMQTVREAYDRWVVPTLVLHGNADTSADPAGSKSLVDAIASKDKTLKLYEAGCHELLHDLDGADAMKQVLQWLEEHS